MNEKFIIGLVFSVIFGAAIADLSSRAPAVAWFVVATIIAQIWANSFENKKRLRVEVSAKKLSKFAKEMSQFKK